MSKTLIQEIALGLAIIITHEPDAQMNWEHDILYAGSTTTDYSPEDIERLEGLGWRLDKECECFSHFN